MTFEAIMNAEMNRRWPDELRAAGNRPLRRERRKRAQKVTEVWSRVRWRAYAMKAARVGLGPVGAAPFAGGGGAVMNLAHLRAVSSCP